MELQERFIRSKKCLQSLICRAAFSNIGAVERQTAAMCSNVAAFLSVQSIRWSSSIGEILTEFEVVSWLVNEAAVTIAFGRSRAGR